MHPRVTSVLTKVSIPGGTVYLSEEERRKMLKEQLKIERLTGLRYLVPIDWITKGNVRSLCISMLLFSLFAWLLHGLIYSQIEYFQILPIQKGDLEEGGAIPNIKILSERSVPYIYYPTLDFWKKDFVGNLLSNVAIEGLQESLIFLSLVTLRPVIYILVGNDLDLLENYFSLTKGYKLFYYSFLRLFIFPALDLLKRSYATTGDLSPSMQVFVEYILPFPAERAESRMAEEQRQEKLRILKEENPKLYEDLMQYKESLHGGDILPRSLLLPWIVDFIKKIIVMFEILVAVLLIAVIAKKLMSWNSQLRKVKRQSLTTSSFIPDWHMKIKKMNGNPQLIVIALLGFPSPLESSQGTAGSLDEELESPGANVTNISSASTSSLGSAHTSPDEQGQFAVIYTMQENGQLDSSLLQTSHYISVLLSLIFSLLFYFFVLAAQISLPMIQVHQGLLLKNPLIGDFFASLYWIGLVWIYVNLVLILIPNSQSKMLYRLQEKVKELELGSGLYYNGLEGLFFRLHRIQSTVYYNTDAKRKKLTQAKETWIDQFDNSSSLDVSSPKGALHDACGPNENFHDHSDPKKSKVQNSPELPSWVHKPLPVGVPLPISRNPLHENEPVKPKSWQDYPVPKSSTYYPVPSSNNQERRRDTLAHNSELFRSQNFPNDPAERLTINREFPFVLDDRHSVPFLPGQSTRNTFMAPSMHPPPLTEIIEENSAAVSPCGSSCTCQEDHDEKHKALY